MLLNSLVVRRRRFMAGIGRVGRSGQRGQGGVSGPVSVPVSVSVSCSVSLFPLHVALYAFNAFPGTSREIAD